MASLITNLLSCVVHIVLVIVVMELMTLSFFNFCTPINWAGSVMHSSTSTQDIAATACSDIGLRIVLYRKRLNGGTVPPFKMHHGGTVPPSKMHHGGTVPPYKMHRGGTVPPFKMHHGGTMTFEKTTFWSNLQNPKTTTTQPYFNQG